MGGIEARCRCNCWRFCPTTCICTTLSKIVPHVMVVHIVLSVCRQLQLCVHLFYMYCSLWYSFFKKQCWKCWFSSTKQVLKLAVHYIYVFHFVFSSTGYNLSYPCGREVWRWRRWNVIWNHHEHTYLLLYHFVMHLHMCWGALTVLC